MPRKKILWHASRYRVRWRGAAWWRSAGGGIRRRVARLRRRMVRRRRRTPASPSPWRGFLRSPPCRCARAHDCVFPFWVPRATARDSPRPLEDRYVSLKSTCRPPRSRSLATLRLPAPRMSWARIDTRGGILVLLPYWFLSYPRDSGSERRRTRLEDAYSRATADDAGILVRQRSGCDGGAGWSSARLSPGVVT